MVQRAGGYRGPDGGIDHSPRPAFIDKCIPHRVQTAEQKSHLTFIAAPDSFQLFHEEYF